MFTQKKKQVNEETMESFPQFHNIKLPKKKKVFTLLENEREREENLGQKSNKQSCNPNAA